jgi:tetratricopeptide (TPR) repeat protein
MATTNGNPAGKALELLKRARALAPGRPDITQRMAHAQELLGRKRSALNYQMQSAEEWAALGQNDAVEKAYRSILSTDPAHAKAGEQLIRLLVDSDRADEALEFVERQSTLLLERSQSAQALEILHLGTELIGASGLQERIAEIQEKTGASADAAQSLLELAGKAREEGKEKEAISYFRRVVALDSENEAALADLAALLEQTGQDPDACRAFLQLANLCERSQRPDECLNWLQRAHATSAPDPALLDRMATLAAQTKQGKDALSYLQQLADLYGELQNTRQHIETLRRLVDDFPRLLNERQRLADALYQQGSREEATAQLLQLADIQHESGETDAALLSYRRAAEWNPRDAGVVGSGAMALVAAGENEEAANLCVQCAGTLSLPRHAQVVRTLVQSALEYVPGLEAARELHIEALTALGEKTQAATEALELARDHGNAGRQQDTEHWVNRARQLHPEIEGTHELLLELAEKSGDSAAVEKQVLAWTTSLVDFDREEEALTVLSQVVERHPSSETLLRRRLTLTEQMNRSEEMVQSLDDLARLYTQSGDMERCAAVRKQAAQLLPDNSKLAEAWLEATHKTDDIDKQSDAHRHLAAQLRIKGNSAALLPHVQWLLEAHPDDLDLARERIELAAPEATLEQISHWRKEMAEAALRSGLTGKALEVYRSLSEEEPSSSEWIEQIVACTMKLGSREDAIAAYRQGLRSVLDAGEPNKALELMQRAVELAPGHTALRAQQAELLEQQGEQQLAAVVYRELSAIYEKEGLLEKATSALASACRLHSGNIGLRRELVELYQRSGMRRAAVEEARSCAEDARDHGDNDMALEMLGVAMELEPSHLPTLRMRFHWLAEQAQVEEAVEAALQLVKLLREEGNHSGALRLLRDAVGLLPDDKQLQNALASAEEDQRDRKRQSRLVDRLEMARELAAEGKHTEAIEDYNEIIISHPDQPEALSELCEVQRRAGRLEDAVAGYMQLARLYQQRGALPVALRQLETILEFLPGNTPALELLVEWTSSSGARGRALEYLGKLARVFASSGDLTAAEKTWRRILDEHPEAIATWNNLAALLEQSERIDEAASAYLEAARQYDRKSNLEEAATAYREAARCKPDCLEAELRLLDLFKRRGRHGEAQPHLLRAVELLEGDGELKQASELLEAFLAEQPHVLELRKRLLELYERSGQTDSLPDEYLALAKLYQQQGDEEAATSLFRALLELDPDEMHAHMALAKSAAKANDKDEAALHYRAIARHFQNEGIYGRATENLQRALEFTPGDLSLREQIAACLISEGIPTKAINEYILIGDSHFRAEDYEESYVAYSRAREIDPENLRILTKLVAVREQCEETSAAARLLFEMADIYQRRSLTRKSKEAVQRALQLAPQEDTIRQLLDRALALNKLKQEIDWLKGELSNYPPHLVSIAESVMQNYEETYLGAIKEKKGIKAEATFDIASWGRFKGFSGFDSPKEENQPQSFATTSNVGKLEKPIIEEEHVDVAALLAEGLKLFSRRRYSRALDKLRQAASVGSSIFTNEELADMYVAMGQCLLEAKQFTEAIERFETGLTLPGLDRERDSALQYGLARAHEENGNKQKALEIFKSLYATNPSYKDVGIRLLWSRK